MEYKSSKKLLVKTSYIYEHLEFFLYSFVCFFAPFLIGHPQLLVGTLVNATLILAAINLPLKKVLPIILLPSLGVLSRGLLFGPFTIYLIYIIPFVWIGNFILVCTFRKLNVNRWLILFSGSILKTIFLFVSVFILVKFAILSPIFLTAFGIFQLYTALLGGALAFSIQASKKLLRISD